MGGPCAPRIALDVKAGRISLDDLPFPTRRGVQAVLIRLGERIVSRLFGMCDVIPMTDGKPGEPGYVVAADYRRRGQ